MEKEARGSFFLSVASFGSLLLFLRKGGGHLTPWIYDLSTENIIIQCSALRQPVS